MKLLGHTIWKAASTSATILVWVMVITVGYLILTGGVGYTTTDQITPSVYEQCT